MRSAILIIGFCLRGTLLIAQEHAAASRLTFPPSVGEFAIASRQDFRDPALGSMARYSDKDSLQVDVYIYPIVGFSGIADGQLVPAPRALAREVAGYKEVLDSGVVRGWYDRYHIAYEEDASIEISKHRIPGFLVMTVVGNGSQTEVTAFYIYYFKDEFVKVRITLPQSEFDGGRPMTTFVEGLIGRLAKSY